MASFSSNQLATSLLKKTNSQRPLPRKNQLASSPSNSRHTPSQNDSWRPLLKNQLAESPSSKNQLTVSSSKPTRSSKNQLAAPPSSKNQLTAYSFSKQLVASPPRKPTRRVPFLEIPTHGILPKNNSRRPSHYSSMNQLAVIVTILTSSASYHVLFK